MEIKYIFLLLAVLFAGDLVESKISDVNGVFLAEFNCISSSGNQKMCNAYLDCLFALSEEYLKPYYICLDKVSLKGVGNCSETEELYECEAKRNELNACYQTVTLELQGKDWTKIPGLFGFKDCVSIAGTNCLTKRCPATYPKKRRNNALGTFLSKIGLSGFLQ
ncbi:hypothetical protein AVEN_75023-1 [Araneus ventricosus]|uniref:DUF19 domain-containing protein n=1 Tax=Araneus ventricosus TaxID=182803 RepID=A0A4Y2GQC3_ARAVE|nr:hypothetical protein AVEN_75023-1 [Araneus ventricosus]